MPPDESETKIIITGLLTSNPLKCTLRQLCDDFYNTVGFRIPCRQLGFSNVEEYLRSIPDTVKIIGFGPTAEVRGVVKEKSAHINQMVIKQKKDSIPAHKRKNIKKNVEVIRQSPRKSNANNLAGRRQTPITLNEDYYASKIPKKIQNNMRKLVLRFPNGLWCRKLPEEYRKMFREELNYEKYSYRSLIEMCSDLQDIFHFIQPSSDDFILYDKSRAIPSFNQNEQHTKHLNKISMCVTELEWSLGSELIPSDVVPFLHEIPRWSFDDLKVGDYLNINVGEIYNIDNFWIFPKHGVLDTLMEKLQNFFNTRGNQYVIPDLFLEEGLYCTVLYKNEYHRCVVTDMLTSSSNCVQVLFIDYGTVGRISKSKIWYLPQQFGDIPCQAIKARLSYIRPIVDSNETIKKFKQLIFNAELVAEIMKIDKKASTLEIYLANVANEDSIFYVNDALVDKGYAEYD